MWSGHNGEARARGAVPFFSFGSSLGSLSRPGNLLVLPVFMKDFSCSSKGGDRSPPLSPAEPPSFLIAVLFLYVTLGWESARFPKQIEDGELAAGAIRDLVRRDVREHVAQLLQEHGQVFRQLVPVIVC